MKTQVVRKEEASLSEINLRSWEMYHNIEDTCTHSHIHMNLCIHTPAVGHEGEKNKPSLIPPVRTKFLFQPKRVGGLQEGCMTEQAQWTGLKGMAAVGTEGKQSARE